MKIIRKLSLRHSLTRLNTPHPNQGWILRKLHTINYPEVTLTPELILLKYGYRANLHNFGFYFAMIIGFMGGCAMYFYLEALNKNQLDTIYRYRLHEQEQSSIFLRLRNLITSYLQFTQRNLILTDFLISDTNLNKGFGKVSEGIFRYKQYRYYQKHHLGVMNKYPYPVNDPSQT